MRKINRYTDIRSIEKVAKYKSLDTNYSPLIFLQRKEIAKHFKINRQSDKIPRDRSHKRHTYVSHRKTRVSLDRVVAEIQPETCPLEAVRLLYRLAFLTSFSSNCFKDYFDFCVLPSWPWQFDGDLI